MGFLVDVVDIQTSNSIDQLTMNAGVLHRQVSLICWGIAPSSFVQEPYCTVRARIGELMDGTDLWWPRDDNVVVEDILQKLSEYVLPFLEKMHSLTALEEALALKAQGKRRPTYPEILYFAVLKYLNGDLVGASLFSVLSRAGGPGVRKWRS
ncbi:MAG TPA: DUF4304 domain-containing protein [Nevskia sp.]|nr:DUF4304 domain-containing protein [Nevskia sp.]